MKSTLWIPCYNEWTQETEFVSSSGQLFSGKRKVALEALTILNPVIQSGTFSRVIVTNDGSVDDTRETLRFFQLQNGYSDRVFTIVDHVDNGGKMLRFMEAFEEQDGDVFVMTDADMIHMGGGTFNNLISSTWPRSTMLASWMGEYNSQHKSYIPYAATTGTRSLVTARAKKVFEYHQISPRWQPGKWYGLEVMLNKLFWFSEVTTTINNSKWDIPLFLQPMRKGRDRQLADIWATEEQMIELLSK